MKKLEYIEQGRLSNDQLSNCLGGVKPKEYDDCSDARGCPIVSGTNLTVVRNCVVRLFSCQNNFSICDNSDDLSSCKTTLIAQH